MIMDIMTALAMHTVFSDLNAIRHLNAGVLTFCLADSASNAIERFDDGASKEGKEPHVFFALSTVW